MAFEAMPQTVPLKPEKVTRVRYSAVLVSDASGSP